MPGLMRGMARTAAVVGTAGAVNHRQQQKWSNQAVEQQPEQYAPEPAAQPVVNDTDEQIAQLQQLAKLKDQGVLTQAEFDAKKQQILGL